MRPRGMTLIEMVVVVMLVAAMSAALAVSIGGGGEGRQLREAARELTAQLQYTRGVAMLQGEPQVFEVDVEARAWRAPGNRVGTLPRGLEVSVLSAQGESADADTAGIRFFPDGSSTGGVVRLGSGEAQWRVEVAWLTGTVTLGRGDPR